MDPQAPGSFIPKQPLVDTRRHVGGGIFILLAILIFVISGVAAGGVFLYQGILKGSIVSKDQQLRQAEGAFQPTVIEDLVRLNGRLRQTEGLLQKHVAPSALFDFLATITLERVQFTGFTYQRDGAGAATISMEGLGDSFSTVALQSDQFGSSRLLKNVVFSDVTIAQTGRVTFSVSATLDPTLYIYTLVAKDGILQVPPPPQPSTPDTTATSSQQTSQ